MDRIAITDERGAVVSEVLIVESLDGLPAVLPERQGRRRVAVFTQPPAARLAHRLARSLRTGGLTCEVRALPDRDRAKTLSVAEEGFLWLNQLELSRLDTVVGVGGGALTDVTGFIAATYLRGIEAVYVPTTLLGAVDASVGGKTGVNVGGKNLVGAFHHPSRILIDLSVLEGLPEEIRREGSAEALKAGLIADPGLVALYEQHGLDAPVHDVVRRAVSVKAAYVSADFTEQGSRALLNYGHTVGHAVEVACSLSHGAAVAVGMVAAGRISSIVTGFGDEVRQRDVIRSLGLPVAVEGADKAAVGALLRLDKKRDGAGLRMALLRTVGTAIITHVDAATVQSGLDAVGIAG